VTPPQHAACVSLSTRRRPGGINAHAAGPQRERLRTTLCALALTLTAGFAQAAENPAANPTGSASSAALTSGAPAPAALSSAAETAGAASANASSNLTLPGSATVLNSNLANPSNASNASNATQNGGPNTGRVVRFGNIGVFRNLIPSPTLEAQAAAEYNEIVRGAAHSKLLYPDSDPHAQRVRQFVDRLAPYSLKWSDRVKNWKWEVAVIRSPDIRMYCLPGGKIVVYGGLLDRVKLNDNELGMLLGHEIAHAVREHVRERLGEQQAAQIESGVVPQLFGLADLGVFPLGIGSRLVEMHYGRADETEADVIGSDIAARAGFDPRAALTLWDKLAVATKADRDQGFIYVHPYTPARRADIAKRLADMMPLYAKAIGKPLNALPDYQGIAAVQRHKLVAAP
jgi:hypothetical protein